MTNANVMALNVQPAAPVKGGKGMPGSVADGSSKGNFDEALGRLQQEAQKGLMSAGKDDTSQDMDARDGGSGREGAPHSPLAMVMALPLQQPVAEEVQTEAPAAVAEFSKDAPVSEALIEVSQDLSTSEAISGKNLHSLLPQSDETAVKNRDFLAMLSGELTSSQKADAEGRLKAALGTGPALQTDFALQREPVLRTETPMQPTAWQVEESPAKENLSQVLPGLDRDISQSSAEQPRNLWQLGQPLQDAEPTDPLGLALRQTARPLGQETQPAVAGQVEVRDTAVQAAQPQLAAAAAETVPVKGEELQAVLGNNITVETAEVQPLRVLRGQNGQGEMDLGQNREESRPAFQAESAQILETEEAPAAVQSQTVSHQAAAPAGFQQHLQNVASTDAPHTSQAPMEAQTDYEVPGQIVEHARLIRSGQDTEMVIHLKPEHLGDLTLKISVTENGAVTASFHSDNAQVRTIIENSLVQLRQELSDQGLKVDSVEVFSGLPDGQLPQGQGQQAWQQGAQGRFAGDRNPEDYADEADDLAAAAQAQSQSDSADDGVDYRV